MTDLEADTYDRKRDAESELRYEADDWESDLFEYARYMNMGTGEEPGK